MSTVRRYPLIAFFVLAFVFSWWPWPLHAIGLAASPIIGFGPFIAAVIVLAVTTGKPGVVALLRRMVRWRVHAGWYAVALLLPIAISAGATMLNIMLGAQPTLAAVGALTGLIPTFILLLFIPGIGGSWEEPGWRGYAQPTLQVGRSALRASLILGAAWAIWHLPLLVIGKIPLTDPISVMAFAIVFTWLFNNTNASILLAMLMHNMNNVISGGFFTAMFSGADWTRQGWLLAALFSATAVIVVIVNGPEHLSRKYRKHTLTPSHDAMVTRPSVARRS